MHDGPYLLTRQAEQINSFEISIVLVYSHTLYLWFSLFISRSNPMILDLKGQPNTNMQRSLSPG